jgi:hypothetical protein
LIVFDGLLTVPVDFRLARVFGEAILAKQQQRQAGNDLKRAFGGPSAYGTGSWVKSHGRVSPWKSLRGVMRHGDDLANGTPDTRGHTLAGKPVAIPAERPRVGERPEDRREADGS